MKDKNINKKPIYLNFNRENKYFGIIDYKSLTIVIIYIFLVIFVLSRISIKSEVMIYVCAFLVIPVVAIFCVNVNNENIVDTLTIIIRFYCNKKIYVDMRYLKYFENVIYKKLDSIEKNSHNSYSRYKNKIKLLLKK